MDDLIARLEAATGPSRELDAEIALSTGWKPLGNIQHWVNSWADGFELDTRLNRPGWIQMKNFPHDQEGWKAPPYTSSIDSALTLVPEGWVRAVDATLPEAGIAVDLFAKNDKRVKGDHVSEAIAICIAALRARTPKG